MSETAAPPTGHHFERVLGRYKSGRPGPITFVVGGLHGNEPAGALAAQRVLAQLEAQRLPLRGELIAVAGNLQALAQDQRYLEQDLNRAWQPEAIRALGQRDPADDAAEQRELRELMALIEEFGPRAEEPPVVLDLHTTSGKSAPFTIMSDTLRNRTIAFALPVPVILGLEEAIDGTLLEYLTERGHRAVVVEAGQHTDPHSVECHEAVIWIGLAAAGNLTPEEVPDYAGMRRRLRALTRGLPRVVEVRYRHAVESNNGFRMHQGFVGFQKIREGELLAHDASGEVHAPMSGRMLMSLYQKLGDDGFFIVRRVSRFWIKLSGVLRRLRLGVLLRLLPGVKKDPELAHALRVNPKIARWFPVEIFHLFGYRRHRRDGETLIFSRRRPG